MRNPFRRSPKIEDPNGPLAEGDGDIYTLELAAILARLDLEDDEDDTANFDLIEQEYND